MKYKLRFFFEFGGYCLWADDERTTKKFGYAIPCDALPISKELIQELTYLEKEFQTSLDWEYPPNPSPWSEEQRQIFEKRTKKAYEKLVIELRECFDIKRI